VYRRVQLYTIQVDDNARLRRRRTTAATSICNDAMFIEAFCQGRGRSVIRIIGTITIAKNRMRCQQHEIDWPYPSLTLKRDVPNAIVINQIGNQERARHHKTPRT